MAGYSIVMLRYEELSATATDTATTSLLDEDDEIMKLLHTRHASKTEKKAQQPTKYKVPAEEASVFQVCECGSGMDKKIGEGSVVCISCGSIREISIDGCTMGSGDGHNTSSNAYMSFKPVGVGSAPYHHQMLRTTSDPLVARDVRTRAKLAHINFESKEFKFPQTVIDDASTLFASLQKHDTTRRGDARKGLLGACMFVAAQQHKVSKTCAQIAKMIGVDESNVSLGYGILVEYYKKGIIDIPQNHDPTPDYINTLIELFDIPTKYFSFMTDLLEKCDEIHVRETISCHIKTKCVGAMYVLSVSAGLGITHDKIAKLCDNISRGTYLNVYNAIVTNAKKLEPVFKKHGLKLV